MDFDSEELNKKVGPVALKAHENYLVEKLVREHDKELVQKLRSTKFENVIHYMAPFDYYIAQTWNASTLRWTIYTPDPVLAFTAFAPWVGWGVTMPLIHPSGDFLKSAGHLNVLNRAWINTLGIGLSFVVNHIAYPKRRWRNDPQFVKDKHDRIG